MMDITPPPESSDHSQQSASGQGQERPSPDLEERRLMSGRLPGARYVRIVRPFAREFKRHAPGHLVATERVLEPRRPIGQALEVLRRTLIGVRIPTEREIHERLRKIKGLAVFRPGHNSSSAHPAEG